MTVCALLAPFLIVAITGILSRWSSAEPALFKREGAVLALDHLREWAKWMTALEAGGLGGLTALLFVGNERTARTLSAPAQFFAWNAFVLLGAALIISAWIFAGLSSIALRIYRIPPETPSASTCNVFDIFQQTIFGGTKSARLGLITTWHHWLWALGLIALGGFALSLLTGSLT